MTTQYQGIDLQGLSGVFLRDDPFNHFVVLGEGHAGCQDAKRSGQDCRVTREAALCRVESFIVMFGQPVS